MALESKNDLHRGPRPLISAERLRRERIDRSYHIASVSREAERHHKTGIPGGWAIGASPWMFICSRQRSYKNWNEEAQFCPTGGVLSCSVDGTGTRGVSGIDR